jgi:DNA-binding transcriptional MerR regulator
VTDVEVSTREAAELANVSEDAIRQWAHRGYLPLARRTRLGHARYWRRHVLALERAKRRGEPLADAINALSH